MDRPGLWRRELEVLVGKYRLPDKVMVYNSSTVRDGLLPLSRERERGGATGEPLRSPRCLGAEDQIHLPPRGGRLLEPVEAAEEAHCSLLYIQGAPLLLHTEC